MAEKKHNGWNGSTDGTPWMQRTLIRILAFCPLFIVYGIMGLVIPFYMLFGKGVRPSYDFYRKRFGFNPVRALSSVYVNEFSLGLVVIDRFAAYAGKKFRLKVVGQDIFDRFTASDSGAVMLSSHVGNYELAGYFLKATKRINALVFSGETETMMKGRSARFGRTNIRMIPIREDLSHIFELNSALSGGEIVSLSGDRSLGLGKSVRLPFLGEDAAFPLGPFTLAAQRGVPVMAVFVMKTGIRSYEVTVEELPYDREVSRSELTRTLGEAYARTLEQHVRRYPYQWYNFYDFWQ